MGTAAPESRVTRPPECPRCGYDLSGTLATWLDQCPLDGLCSECGLRFEYRHLLNPELSQQARFIETARSTRGGLGCAFVTSARRCLIPWTFWKWVRMEDPPYPERIGPSVGATLLAYQLLLSGLWLLLFACFAIVESLTSSYGFWHDGAFRMAVNPLAEWDYEGDYLFGVEWLGRTFAFGAFVAAFALVMPLTFLLLPQTFRKAKVKRLHLVRIAAWGCVGLIVIAHLLGGGMRAMIEFFHLILQVLFSVLIVDSSLYELRQWRGHVMLGCSVAWLVAWWGFACSRYLRLNRGWLIAFVMSILAMLIASLLIIAVPDLSYYYLVD